MNENFVILIGCLAIAGAIVLTISLVTVIGEAVQRYYDR